MGDVYIGLNDTLQRKVAVKAIRTKSRLNPQAKARFLREARVLLQLKHPNICQIHDYIEGETDDASQIIEKAKKAETKPFSGLSADLTTLINRLKSLVPTARPSAVETADKLHQIREKPKKRLRNGIISAVAVVFVLMGMKYTMDLRQERRLAMQARDEATNVVKFLVDLFEVSDPGEARGNTITAREILNKGATEKASRSGKRYLGPIIRRLLRA